MEKLKIGVIVGSTRPSRIGLKIAEWFMREVEGTEVLEFELIDLAVEDLPFLNEPKSAASGEYVHETTKKWSEKIAGYDGYVFVTAEYNHGYPAPLKNAFDLLYHEWSKKPVAFVGYGTLGAARAIEQLLMVISRANMVGLTTGTLNVIKAWDALDEKGNVDPNHLIGNKEFFIENLHWWARALKSAR